MKPEVIFALESAAWPALLVAADGAVLMANQAAHNVFTTSLEGDPAQLASIWAPENGNSAAVFLSHWEVSREPQLDLKFRPPTGSEKTYSTALTIIESDDNKWFVFQLLPPTKSVVVQPRTVEPVTEFRSAPTGDAALKQKLDCVLQLARTVSLDFNNALTGVLAHTSLLLSKAETNHPWRRSLLEVEKAASRAAEIAGELALFSRQEKEARRAPAGNLNAVVTHCMDFLRNAHGNRITWRLTPERSLFEARFDEAKVQQALTKVFENAVESFGDKPSGQIAVETRNVELTEPTQDRNVRLAAGTYVCVEIADNGAGIEPEAMPRIFEPFFTTKQSPHRGLGLALVYGIITNHGGGVAVSSQLGSGTSARVYLPAEKSRIHEIVGTDRSLHGTGTILVVDDEALLLTMAETILTEFGYRVLTASNGQKALDVLEKPGLNIQLVITDLVMPGMGGRELIERIHQWDMDLPIICMSGYVMPEDQQGETSYLQKPFTTSDLLLKVKETLGAGTTVD